MVTMNCQDASDYCAVPDEYLYPGGDTGFADAVDEAESDSRPTANMPIMPN
ncbi:hypothetical protein GNI_040590 [Gregarina niphandrodes]|uniref:Uncharacterized protein n=1 Tax=Gregarina niphandrodes TaxID=110365 RepID=A0A023BA83_GRENI|nr:hypothetical protein GNI_040590 [Gregarina niphandrodes]EZG78158.1 hypothetical protein GNI_040590 [Gregarina niphandrodes]|eukprot:XP_011129443.1 hypothetical protein GNI_040590 [Gregarina niphandrodes]